MNIEQITKAIKIIQNLNTKNEKDSTELTLYKKYFELKNYESEDQKHQTKLNDFVLEKDDLITEQSLLDLGFKYKYSSIWELNKNNISIRFDTGYNMVEIKFSNLKRWFKLEKSFAKKSELVNLLNSIF